MSHIAFAMPSAVPEGASFLKRWCASSISMSYLSPSNCAAFAASIVITFTTRLKFGACTIGIDLPALLMSCSSESVSPVVPMTIAMLASTHCLMSCRVNAGVVKSMSVSQ